LEIFRNSLKEDSFSRNEDSRSMNAWIHKRIFELCHMVEVKSYLTSHIEYCLFITAFLRKVVPLPNLRVAFDGSAELSSGVSLNRNLLSGFVVQPELLSIVFEFKTFDTSYC
jgi:hypothetical protein